MQTGPLVVVTGRFEDADADALAALPHHSSLPVLLTVAPIHDAADRAENTGWRVAAIPPGADLAAVWSATADRGGRRVAR